MEIVDVRARVGQLVAVVVLGTIFVGPPLWFLSRLFSGAPLWATKTVTVEQTQHYGVLPEAVGILMLWLLISVITYGMATGAFPRRIH